MYILYYIILYYIILFYFTEFAWLLDGPLQCQNPGYATDYRPVL